MLCDKSAVRNGDTVNGEKYSVRENRTMLPTEQKNKTFFIASVVRNNYLCLSAELILLQQNYLE